MTRMYSQHRRGGVLVGVIVLLVLAAAGLGIYLAVRGRATNRGLALAGIAPQTAVAVGAIEEPVTALTKGVEFMNNAAAKDKHIQEQWESAQKELKEKTGIDVNDPATVAASGFDVTQPITFAVLQVEPNTFSANVLVSVGVSDGNKVLATLKKGAPSAKDEAGEPPISILGADMGVCVKDGRLYALCVTKAKDGAAVTAALRDFFKQREAAPLSALDDFKQALSTLPPGGEATLFVSLTNVVRAMPFFPKTSPLVSDYQSLSISHAEGRTTAYLAMRKDSALLQEVEPGGTCQEFLSKMDSPVAALTFSLKDPAKLVTTVMSESDRREFSSMDASLKELFGMDLSEIGKLFQDTAGGVAFYPPAKHEEFTPVDFIFFVKTNNRAKIEEMLKVGKQKDGGNYKVETFGANTLYEERDENFGIVGDYVVASNRAELLRTIAQEKGGGWKPRAGKRDLIDMEVLLGDIVRKMGRKTPDSVEKAMEESIDADASIFIQATKQPSGIFFDAEPKGIKLSAAVPALVDALDREKFATRSRAEKAEGQAVADREAEQRVKTIAPVTGGSITENESAALNDCHAYVAAQVKFPEGKPHEMGFQAYAQNLHELYQNQGGAPTKLIDIGLRNADANHPDAKPHNGYLFKVLKGDAKNGSYLVNKHMYNGFALVAFPAEYGVTGKDTFIVDQAGTVYKKDLGAGTHDHAMKMSVFPDTKAEHWKPAK